MNNKTQIFSIFLTLFLSCSLISGDDELEYLNVCGTIYDSETRNPIDSATITVDYNEIVGMVFYSDSAGYFETVIPPEDGDRYYNITIQKAGYLTYRSRKYEPSDGFIGATPPCIEYLLIREK